MKEKLNLALVQFPIEWENAELNRNKLDGILENISADIILLPEMFSSGFSVNVNKIAEESFGETYRWMKQKSKEKNCALVGSISTFENEKYYNRMYFVSPEENYTYDKKHLFSYGREAEAYTGGNEIITIEHLGWKIRLSICYDLRFPVWLRNTDNYDLLINVANWPATRDEVWKALLKARAIENVAYVAGVNTIGEDGYELKYIGNSKVYNPIGEEVKLNTKDEFVLLAEIDKSKVIHFREKYRFLDDKDNFKII